MAAGDIAMMPRRGALGGGLALAMLTLSGCASIRHRALVNAIRKLLRESAHRAIAKLTGPDGLWAREVRRMDLPGLMGRRGAILGNLLTSPRTRDRLDDLLNRLAEQATRRAAPTLAFAVERMGIANARALVEGGPTAASEYLHSQVGQRLVEDMIPGLAEAIRVVRDPLINDLFGALTGIDLEATARALAYEVDRAIWTQLGVEEAAIRSDPYSTGDAELIEVFGRR